MATNSVVEFRYSDRNTYFAMYLSSNSSPETLIPKLRKYMEDLDTDNWGGRWNWDYFSSQVFGKFVADSGGVKLLRPDQIGNSDGMIFYTIVTPVSSRYSNNNMEIGKCIEIDMRFAGGQQVYNGLLSDFDEEAYRRE